MAAFFCSRSSTCSQLPNHEFFRGKPTSREVSSQHPYAEHYIGKPHVITADFNNSEEFEAAVRESSMSSSNTNQCRALKRLQQNQHRDRSNPHCDFCVFSQVEPLIPFEYTCEGMLERVNAYIQHQGFCQQSRPFPAVNESRSWPGNPPSPFVQPSNSTALIWAPNISAPACWPPLRALRLFLSPEDSSCVKTCQDAGFICEPAFFPFINSMEAFSGLDARCESLEAEKNHVFPAVQVERRECFVQKDPLLFSCAGFSAKHQRLCPCRDYLQGQVALCRDCV
ncbi:Alpha-1,6-mannosylglycoprotein 6-beta-N-acetylglucosaminyltransferase B [Triplophysa tibetana]|uniref:alpha-1,6-mannosyl-glycoprotein 6-beta-N-acetylglucosaminyltransferase n=1 Tax=Triplophysa tibetana TaxID=1572043 RepID=A0A5A9N8I2_9TELE|nr:Alpha-1,6-mannosylglycoprotein 6-beta-N-acetylglucosaminyltransferase B [Triplophysa tibetana]